jgi:hypothetical protein
MSILYIPVLVAVAALNVETALVMTLLNLEVDLVKVGEEMVLVATEEDLAVKAVVDLVVKAGVDLVAREEKVCVISCCKLVVYNVMFRFFQVMKCRFMIQRILVTTISFVAGYPGVYRPMWQWTILDTATRGSRSPALLMFSHLHLGVASNVSSF